MTRDAEILQTIRQSADPLRREWSLTAAERVIDETARTVELSVSSEAEVERWFGIEVLDHGPKAIRLERFRNNAALLLEHDRGHQIGKVFAPQIRDRKLRVTIQFSRSDRASEIFQDVVDDIRSLVSIGYRIHEVKTTTHKGGMETVRVVDWEPYEVSFVSIPADTSVGVGRSLNPENTLCETSNTHRTRPVVQVALPPHLTLRPA